MGSKANKRKKLFRGKDIDYKDVDSLKKLLSEQGKVLGRKRTGTNAYVQRQIATAVKRARIMGLLPFVSK